VTNNDDTISEIIKATNSQTEVKYEAFEILKPFHKKLEEFYLSFKDQPNKQIYYERRAKQFGLKIKQDRIIGLSNQISAFLSMFLNEPHSTHRYFGELLKSYGKRMFLENHSPWPYYTCGLALVMIEEFFRDNKLFPEIKKFKYHLLLLIRIEINGKQSIQKYDSNKDIEKYCKKKLDVIWDEEIFYQLLLKLQDRILMTLKKTKLDRRQAHATKSFTEELLPELVNINNRKAGIITYYNNKKGYGFIRTSDSEDYFFHLSDLSAIEKNGNYEGTKVTFEPIETQKGSQARYLRLFRK